MKYKGSCHCGRIAYEIETEISEVMECNCSICQRKGQLLTFVPRSQLKLTTPESAMSTYTFNKQVIQHHFCPNCGCAPFGEGKAPDGTAMAALNVRCIDGIDLKSLKVNLVDGRSL